MTDPKIKSCFITGLVLFVVNMVFGLPKFLPIFLLTSNILPGFIFGFTLISNLENKLDWKVALFFLLSGGLYIAAAWIATGFSFFGNDIYLCFPLASILGAVTLLIAYKYLLDQSLSLRIGILYAIIAGIISSILPVVSDILQINEVAYWLYLTCTLSIYITWQTLFGWTLKQAERKPLPQLL